MKVESGYRALQRIDAAIKGLKDSHGYIDDEFEVDGSNEEEKYLRDISHSVLDKISSLSYELEWLTSPVSAEGRLVRNASGRYEIEGTDVTFTSGSTVDAYDEEEERWYHTRVEHNGDDYYIVALGRDFNIVDTFVRMRRS